MMSTWRKLTNAIQMSLGQTFKKNCKRSTAPQHSANENFVADKGKDKGEMIHIEIEKEMMLIKQHAAINK